MKETLKEGQVWTDPKGTSPAAGIGPQQQHNFGSQIAEGLMSQQETLEKIAKLIKQFR